MFVGKVRADVCGEGRGLQEGWADVCWEGQG